MTESAVRAKDIICPGCHFGCRLEKYQCGRGKEFYDMASAGKELPVRRGPVLTPSERAKMGGKGAPPLNDRVMHAFNIMANVVQKRHTEAGTRKVVSGLARAGGFMSLALIPKRMLLAVDEANAAVAEACEAGWVELDDEGNAGRVVRLTELGRDKAAEVKRDRDASTAEFLAPLSDEEKETLATLVRKLLVR